MTSQNRSQYPSTAQLSFPSAVFSRSKIADVNHSLCDSPLFSFESLAQLATQLPKKQVRFHATSARAGDSLVHAETEHAHVLGLETALKEIETSGSWIALHYVQTVPSYREFLQGTLQELWTHKMVDDDGIFHPAMWIFIQSPGAVTPISYGS